MLYLFSPNVVDKSDACTHTHTHTYTKNKKEKLIYPVLPIHLSIFSFPKALLLITLLLDYCHPVVRSGPALQTNSMNNTNHSSGLFVCVCPRAPVHTGPSQHTAQVTSLGEIVFFTPASHFPSSPVFPPHLRSSTFMLRGNMYTVWTSSSVGAIRVAHIEETHY
ncbi:hypothetical protein CRM22_005013 [Opisthorchis felineus]|uniref:Uncharacterized protein n=1 Tax=Opisthorchis felineus TaxID=147828 RepID=A0A4S2LT97_OPIFE|nr:hypothetical protein CRM22_005013 [Opisthorchis felineus]